eukprot:3797530-Prymnesium_polylepis.1
MFRAGSPRTTPPPAHAAAPRWFVLVPDHLRRTPRHSLDVTSMLLFCLLVDTSAHIHTTTGYGCVEPPRRRTS